MDDHRGPEGDPGRTRHALVQSVLSGNGLDRAVLEELLDLARGLVVRDHRRELRGQRDQECFLALVESARVPLLSDQHPKHPTVCDDGYAEEGVERFLTDLRDQVETRMAGGVAEVYGFRPFRH